MNIGSGAEIYIYHFSSKNNIKANVLSVEGNMLTIQTEDIKAYNSISEGEPVVMFCISDQNIIISGCVVSSRSAMDTMLLVMDNSSVVGENKRLYERYPVSYYADLKVVNEPKRYVAFLKDISKYGLRIFTDAELGVGKKVEISLYLEKRIIFITTQIVRGIRGKSFNDYGSILKIEDYQSVREMSNLIRMTTQEYMDRFINKNLLNEQAIQNYDLNYDPCTNRFILNENKNMDSIIAKFGDIIRRSKN